jgi:uncharacterized protein (DUF4415 family)/uncharacterized DUF497 family protein
VDIAFDPAKDGANIAKHGMSLAVAELIEIQAVIREARADYGEDRFNAFGTIEDIALPSHCAAARLGRSACVAQGTRRRAVISIKHPPELADNAPFDDPDNPEWTAADFARARPLADFPFLVAALAAKHCGRPLGSTRSDKSLVSLRLNNDVIERFRADGPGWQSRINATLRVAKM